MTGRKTFIVLLSTALLLAACAGSSPPVEQRPLQATVIMKSTNVPLPITAPQSSATQQIFTTTQTSGVTIISSTPQPASTSESISIPSSGGIPQNSGAPPSKNTAQPANLPKPASSPTAPRISPGMGALAGHVSIGPLSPVQRIDQPEPTPPPEAYADRQVVVYARDGRTEAARVPIGPDGNYFIELAPGTYVVDINHAGLDRAEGLPAAVTIHQGETTTLDISIDTGIR